MVLKKPILAIVDYGLGNLYSIGKACEIAGMSPLVTNDANQMALADGVLLPGVGAFGDAMEALRTLNLVDTLKGLAADRKPMIGICLGLQLMMTSSDEFGRHEGLNLIAGTVEKLPMADAGRAPGHKVPQVGWKPIEPGAKLNWEKSPLDGVKQGAYLYFVHSFHVKPTSDAVVLSESDFGGYRFCSSVMQDSIFACQFHPEKSGAEGLTIYRNICRLLSEGGF